MLTQFSYKTSNLFYRFAVYYDAIVKEIPVNGLAGSVPI